MNEGPRRFTITDPSTITDPTALSIGLSAYTGQGKTESSCRLAHGIARVTGRRVVFADCDNGRGLHFFRAGMFKGTEYIDFKPPHNALDYVDLLEQFENENVVLVIDNMTAEHEGEGGLLDTKEAAMYDRNGKFKEGRTAVAWGIAKGQHKKLVRTFVRVNRKIPIIVTWRAQEKLDWSNKNEDGKTEPKKLGEMPIGSKDLPFEMTATYLLPPGSKGAPCLAPVSVGECMMTKIPRWFEGIVKSGEKFCEAHGEAMARWAFGSPADPVATMRARLDAVRTPAELDAVSMDLAAQFPKGHPARSKLNGAYKAAAERARGTNGQPSAAPPAPTSAPADPDDYDRSSA